MMWVWQGIKRYAVAKGISLSAALVCRLLQVNELLSWNKWQQYANYSCPAAEVFMEDNLLGTIYDCNTDADNVYTFCCSGVEEVRLCVG
jgi:hypothetical protein